LNERFAGSVSGYGVPLRIIGTKTSVSFSRTAAIPRVIPVTSWMFMVPTVAAF
jgi:hypothetical protein